MNRSILMRERQLFKQQHSTVLCNKLQAVVQLRPGKVNSQWSQADSKILLSSQGTNTALFVSRTAWHNSSVHAGISQSHRTQSQEVQGNLSVLAETRPCQDNLAPAEQLQCPCSASPWHREMFSSLDAALDPRWLCGAIICNTPHAGFSPVWDSPSPSFPLPWTAKLTKSAFLNCFMIAVIYCVIRSERTPQK